MPVVGTAGHVDHGKSTLVLALTGRDPDRWAEEKARGLTIDLGFAWATLDDGTEVSFVDVPGHERYAKNMLAGIETIDVALLVVAADEGWMPQSEEHLAVLDLLEVRRGVVALTKVDRVDEETAALAALDVEERLAGSTLAGSPIVAVSAVTGRGLDEVRAALTGAARSVAVPREGRPRLWVDRSFSIAGAGTVVTGTLLDGSLAAGDRVAVWPGPREARVRSLQSHEREVERVGPGRRVAAGLAGLERDEAGRGAMIGLPGQWVPTTRFLGTLRTARYVEEIADRGAYHLHLGSGAWPVRIARREEAVLVDLPVPLTLEVGDRFILRDTGRRQVVAGGRVLDPSPRPGRPPVGPLLGALDASPDERATTLLDLRSMEDVRILAAHSGGGTPAALIVEGTAVSAATASALAGRAEDEVRAFHAANPLRPGMPLAALAGRLDAPPGLVEALVAGGGPLALADGLVRSADFGGGLTAGQEEAWSRARAALETAGLAVPGAGELGLDRELLHALVRLGRLVRVSPDLVYLPAQIEELTSVVRSMEALFTVSEFKDRAGVSRKYAVPFLEWCDATGRTVRMGDRRRRRD